MQQSPSLLTVVPTWFYTLQIIWKGEKSLRTFLDKILSSSVWATETNVCEALEGLRKPKPISLGEVIMLDEIYY